MTVGSCASVYLGHGTRDSDGTSQHLRIMRASEADTCTKIEGHEESRGQLSGDRKRDICNDNGAMKVLILIETTQKRITPSLSSIFRDILFTISSVPRHPNTESNVRSLEDGNGIYGRYKKIQEIVYLESFNWKVPRSNQRDCLGELEN